MCNQHRTQNISSVPTTPRPRLGPGPRHSPPPPGPVLCVDVDRALFGLWLPHSTLGLSVHAARSTQVDPPVWGLMDRATMKGFLLAWCPGVEVLGPSRPERTLWGELSGSPVRCGRLGSAVAGGIPAREGGEHGKRAGCPQPSDPHCTLPVPPVTELHRQRLKQQRWILSRLEAGSPESGCQRGPAPWSSGNPCRLS